MRLLTIAALVAAVAVPVAAWATGMSVMSTTSGPAIYPTFGVHNPPQYSPCPKSAVDCLNQRTEGEPSDPLYPQQWMSHWNMYRVFDGYKKNPPPYTDPPSRLKPSQYEHSEGWTAYDSTYRADHYPDSGAMIEYYKKRCLPIFPIPNNYTCAFISLGKTAYFLTFDEDRPAGMPPCCLFSRENHPPRRDFVKHLPYSKDDSGRVKDIQAYSLTTPGPGNEPILFEYAFEKAYRADKKAPEAGSYRHPFAFYFSGSTEDPPNAPIVTQNYTDFSAIKPDPARTWDLVAKMCRGKIPDCELFQ